MVIDLPAVGATAEFRIWHGCPASVFVGKFNGKAQFRQKAQIVHDLTGK
jgi:hypothetical protein